MKEIVVLLLLITSLDRMKSFSVQPSENQQYEVEINHFHWPADAASVGTIPDVESLHFIYFQGDTLPQNFTDQFQKCTSVTFDGGNIETIHISPKLTQIVLVSIRTENMIIERGKYYQMKKFECRGVNLTRIPKNMNELKKLKYLHLDHNLIQTVQLDQFNGLDNLETLVLYSNKIKQINNLGPVSLPSLTWLNLGYNELKHIDVCSWNMSKLSHLNLFGNNLIYFAINHLSGLEEVNLAGNPLNCVWKNSLLRDRTDTKMLGQLTCDTNSEGFFGFDCPSTIYQLQQQNSNFDSRLAQIEGTVLNNNQQFSEFSNRVLKSEAKIDKRLQKIEELLIHFSKKVIEQQNVSNDRAEIERTYNRRFEKIEEMLEKLSTKIVEQQNISNDLIEAFYRAEIERTNNSKERP